MDKYLPQRIPILDFGGIAMRNVMTGLVVLGLVTIGTGTAATAHPLGTPAVKQTSIVERVDWDECGPRCREHRGEAHEREWEHRRWAEHRRWEEHREGEGRRSAPPPYGNQQRY
jgi:hypothetical protein